MLLVSLSLVLTVLLVSEQVFFDEYFFCLQLNIIFLCITFHDFAQIRDQFNWICSSASVYEFIRMCLKISILRTV